MLDHMDIKLIVENTHRCYSL